MNLITQFDRHRRRWAALAAVLTLAALPWLARLGVDNSIEVWIDREAQAYSAYREFLDAFGSEEYVLVLYRLPADVDLPFLERLTDLRFELEEIDGVKRVRDLAQVYARGFNLLGLEAFHRELDESPFYRNFLISTDGKTAATWIELDGGELRDRGELVESVQAAIDASSIAELLPDGKVHLAGSPVIDYALDEGSRNASRTLFPLVFLLSAILLLFFFPRPYGVVIPFLSVGAGIIWILALMAVAGRTLNMVTVTLPPLLWVLGLSTSIHLLSRCRQLLAAGSKLDEAIRHSMAELARPCLLSAFTTALGFGSLVASTMQPVREMGVCAALGILACLAGNFLLFPFLARALPPRPPASEVLPEGCDRGVGQRHPVLHALAVFVQRHPLPIVVAAAGLGLALLVSLLGLRADANVIGFFKRDSPTAVTYNQVLAGFTGPYSVEILLTPEREPVSLDAFRQLDALGSAFASQPGVAKVLSAADLVKKAHQRSTQAPPEVHVLPEDEAAFAQAWQDAGDHLGDELDSFYHAGSGTLRLSALAQPMGSAEHRRLLDGIRSSLSMLDDTWRTRLTGIVPLLVDMQEHLLESQIRSFGLAFLLIGPVIALLLRSVRYAALSLTPNLTPIVLSLGVMSLFDIALDPATVMIAGIALGIAVDDTIHLLESYLRRRRAGLGADDAVDESMQTVGRAMMRTSVVATVGFLVLCFSEFLPLLYFGLFTGLAMVAAMAAALVVLPALLLLAEGTLTPGPPLPPTPHTRPGEGGGP